MQVAAAAAAAAPAVVVVAVVVGVGRDTTVGVANEGPVSARVKACGLVKRWRRRKCKCGAV